jgi:hypothetical protein
VPERFNGIVLKTTIVEDAWVRILPHLCNQVKGKKGKGQREQAFIKE